MIINISDVWEDARAQHVYFLNEIIDRGIERLGRSALHRKTSKFIKNNKDLILSGAPEELQLSIDEFNEIFSAKEKPKAVEIFRSIFDYEDFSKKNTTAWGAYKLCKAAKYKTCCYCHLVEIGTSLPNEETRGYRPPIDHYYAKSQYPFLSLTLNNFVLCCEKCNGPQMKWQIDFSEEKHLNPLVNNESIEFVLECNDPNEQSIAEIMGLKLSKDKYRLNLKITENIELSKASINTFQLVDRYQNYAGQAFHLAKKMKGLSSRLRMLDDALDVDISINDILEFEPENYKSIPYGKARLCIANQFGNAN